MQNFKLEQAFPSPVAVIDNSDLAPLNDKLRSLFLEREARGSEFKNANPPPTVRKNIFDSEMALFEDPDPAIQQLHRYCMTSLYQLIGKLSGYSESQLSQLRVRTNAWFHITRDRGYISTHNHPVSSWSGVYYVDPGRPVSSEKDDNGILRFIDTRSGNAYLDAGNMNMAAPFHFGSLNFHPVGGRLILFPSFLQHEATPFEGDGTRISVAFNSVFHWQK